MPPHPRVDDPATADDPGDPAADDVPVLSTGDAEYQAIHDWIAAAGSGCT
jgi:hypothetical protein